MSDAVGGENTAIALVFWNDEDRCYVAQSIEYRHVSAFGNTEEEALAELDIALAGVMEVLAEKGESA